MNLEQKILEALKILELPEKASIKEIEKNYKRLIYHWHPDKCNDKAEICNEKTRQLVEAKKLLLDYSKNYPICFTDKEEIKNNASVDEFWEKRFGSDPLWGK